MDGLTFVNFAFEDVDAERVEDFFLNRTLERTRTVNRIVAFARNQFFGRVGKIERDFLLLETFR